MGCTVKNCLFVGIGLGVRLVVLGGSGTGYGTGLRVQNNTFLWINQNAVQCTYPAGAVLTNPSMIFANDIKFCSNGLVASHTSQLAEGCTVTCWNVRRRELT